MWLFYTENWEYIQSQTLIISIMINSSKNKPYNDHMTQVLSGNVVDFKPYECVASAVSHWP